MRTRRAKTSESFWPSIVMKKWLNIKPKVHEFSEDEVDTESEDDDAKSIGRDSLSGVQGNQSVCQSHTSGTPSKGYPSRLRRGKSETLRVQYINTKDIRITIGTWNVAGRIPHDHLEIDGWLCTDEPADMYILGFQEVVPLNAGNVLGAEDSRPIPKWVEIIRKTLNKTVQPKAERPKASYKSYSAPPSPEFTTSTTNVLQDEICAPEAETGSDEDAGFSNCGFSNCALRTEAIGGVTNLGKKFQLKRIYSISNIGGFNWPERSLDTAPQVLTSDTRLRRVLSSSARIGFEWLEKPQICAHHVGLKRMHWSSGNLQLIWPEQQEGSEVLNSLSDVGSNELADEGEDSSSKTVMGHGKDRVDQQCRNSRTRYVRIVSKQMVGIYVSIWVRKKLRQHINNLKVSPVGVGLMGYMGNKGSVSISMSLFQTRLCFVCSHLTSGQKHGDQQKRNSDVFEILRRTRFTPVFDADQPQTIPSHDKIFWFGDLNYRLNMLDAEARKLAALKQWDELISSDQLCKELRRGYVFDGWKEGSIEFAPTYKYEFNSDIYAGENAKEGEKKRTPAWCDRILWFGKGVKQLSYRRAELKLSDHRPVSSMFLVEVEVFDHRKLHRALNFTNAGLIREQLLEEEGDNGMLLEDFLDLSGNHHH